MGTERIGTRRPERLLLVESNANESAELQAALEQSGFAVVGPTASGADAVEMAKNVNPDMAVVDPTVSARGASALDVISRECGVPTIVALSEFEPRVISEIVSASTYGVIHKPVLSDLLAATIEVAWNRYLDRTELEDECERLRQRLEDRKTIEQAKWILVERRKVTEPDAMRMLQRQARNTRRTLVDIARALIENEALLTDI